jgi:hypothetical protein
MDPIRQGCPTVELSMRVCAQSIVTLHSDDPKKRRRSSNNTRN